ncbi:MCM10-like protein [Spatholobus suberectus]|nr:MCM10-like protein [Spatholobus suberectus]
MMSSHDDDLDLLLSLHDTDRVADTPPSPSPSPSPSPGIYHSHFVSGYLSDDESPKQREKPDMSVFKNAVQDCLPYDPPKPTNKPVTNDSQLEKFSGLRIRNQLLTPAELREHFSDIRFVRLSVIKNSLTGDTFSGSWATVGVLTEKGTQKTSSSGKGYCIWKIGSLDENTVSLFLFGDAYQKNMQEQAGTVFALFNCSVRKDTVGNGFSLSIYSPRQIMKMGTSVDYGVCKGKRTDGLACTLVINKRHGTYCKYHKSKASEKYSTMRSELKGGNLRTAFRPRDYLKSEGIYLVDPLADKTNLKKSQPVKLLSVDGLRKALSNAGKVTTTTHSQGIRFLSEVAGKSDQKMKNKGPKAPNEQNKSTEKRKSSFSNVGSSAVIRNQQLDVKRIKPDGQVLADKTTKSTGKMIELDLVSSDEDF